MKFSQYAVKFSIIQWKSMLMTTLNPLPWLDLLPDHISKAICHEAKCKPTTIKNWTKRNLSPEFIEWVNKYVDWEAKGLVENALFVMPLGIYFSLLIDWYYCGSSHPIWSFQTSHHQIITMACLFFSSLYQHRYLGCYCLIVQLWINNLWWHPSSTLHQHHQL